MSAKTVPGTPSWLRQTNDRTALTLLLEHGVLTRNRIGELSGLSKPTASQIVARLEGAGIIHAVGEVSGGRGPNAASYAVKGERLLGVAVDIDERVIRSTLVDATGAEHAVVETPIAAGGSRSATADIRDAIEHAREASGVTGGAIRFVSIGVEGSIDPRTDELSFIDSLPGWPRSGLRATLERELGIGVHIDNNVNLAAIAERIEGAGAGLSSFALLWMGDGLGLSVDLAGSVHRGAAGGAGEIGYLPAPKVAASVDPAAADLQDLLGGATVVALAGALGIPGTDARTVAAHLAGHARRGDLLTELAPRIALGVVPVLAILDPEVIVLGGPMGAAGGAELATLVSRAIERDRLWKPRITTTALSDDPVLRGAREVLLVELRERLFSELESLQ